MKCVLNTNYKEAGGITVIGGIIRRLEKQGSVFTYNDWDHYGNYDLAFFLAPDSKIREAKRQKPGMFCILFDPKANQAWQRAEARAADMLIVSSIEQREFFLQFNKNIFIYLQFPDIPEIKKEHTKKDKIIIGYHGNKQHLDAMSQVSVALDRVAEKHNIELWAIYNIKKLGKWRRNVPKKCPVKHVQWSHEELISSLSQCDVGISPSVLPLTLVDRLFARPWRTFIPRFFNYEGFNKNDYLLRFKYSNNPGRIYVFSQLGVPVISDFTPSVCQVIDDGKSGLLAGTTAGWERALTLLVTNAEARNAMSTNLKNYLDEHHSVDKNFDRLMQFVNTLYAAR